MEWEVKKVTGGFRQLDENEGFSKSFGVCKPGMLAFIFGQAWS
jgi:hypothetical protein